MSIDGYVLLKHGNYPIRETNMNSTPIAHVRAGRVVSALQERVIGTRSAAADHQWFLFFLDSGHAVAQARGTDYEMSGPALRWGPLDDDTRLRIGAGSSGFYLFFNQSMLDAAIGDFAEAAELRMLCSQHLFTSLGRNDEMTPRLEDLFERIVNEAGTPAFGNDISISAYLRLVLVYFRRNVEIDAMPPDPDRSTASEIALFRNLVEAHFRARWTAKHYSRELGMSYDRLHDICLRTVGKPPARLLRERTLREAQLLLRRTSMSIERIAAMLGFSSSSQFSHFFKSMTDQTPGRFRKQRTDAVAASDELDMRFADWP